MSAALKVVILPAADADLKRQLERLDQNAGLETALRFYDAALSSCNDLGAMPGMGTIVESRIIPDLRRWQVRGFEKILIFYRFDNAALSVIRILHGAMDLNSILNDEWEMIQ